LATNEKIVRVARGIYARLEEDKILGTVKPSTEVIAEAIRRRDKAKIIPKIFNTIVRLNPKILVPILFVLVLIILYYVKPQIILKKDKKTKKSLNKISYPKLLMWSCIIVIPVIIFYMLKFKLIIQK
jgi:hypothetical protein